MKIRTFIFENFKYVLKKKVYSLCMSETTVKALGKKLAQKDTVLTVKFLLNSKEILLEVVWNMGIICDFIKTT